MRARAAPVQLEGVVVCVRRKTRGVGLAGVWRTCRSFSAICLLEFLVVVCSPMMSVYLCTSAGSTQG